MTPRSAASAALETGLHHDRALPGLGLVDAERRSEQFDAVIGRADREMYALRRARRGTDGERD